MEPAKQDKSHYLILKDTKIKKMFPNSIIIRTNHCLS